MPIAVRATQWTNYSLSSPYDVSVTKPAGTANGDLIFVHFVHSSSTTTTDLVPAGWTTLVAHRVNSDYTWSLFSKVASSEPASWTWSFANTGQVVCGVVVLSGTDGTVDTATYTEVTTGTAITHSFTTTVANSMLVSFTGADATSSALTYTNSSGSATEHFDQNESTEWLASAGYTEPAPTATSYSRDFTISGSQQWHVVVVAARPAVDINVKFGWGILL